VETTRTVGNGAEGSSGARLGTRKERKYRRGRERRAKTRKGAEMRWERSAIVNLVAFASHAHRDPRHEIAEAQLKLVELQLALLLESEVWHGFGDDDLGLHQQRQTRNLEHAVGDALAGLLGQHREELRREIRMSKLIEE